jgi:hypothetical protein
VNTHESATILDIPLESSLLVRIQDIAGGGEKDDGLEGCETLIRE